MYFGEGAPQPRAVADHEFVVPQTWFEWIHTLYDPRKFILQRQHFGTRLAVPAQTNGTAQAIAATEPFFCFNVRSVARVTAGGGTGLNSYPAAGYNVGVKEANGNDWFNGQWAAEMITGDISRTNMWMYDDWFWPRPLAENQQITVTIDNGTSVANDSLRVDFNLVGYVLRTFTVPQRAAV
jgi:hypothetical protein